MSDQYEMNECIGKGSFGEVFKGRELSTGRIVALKLVDLEKADDEIEIIQREIEVMSQISNPHVVQYYGSSMKGSTLIIVMEFMSGGSLKDLVDCVGPFPEDAIATVLKPLCKGLDYVHKGHKLHRDIKAANILLSAQGDVKLADFGVAGQLTSTMGQRNTFVGSPFWMAPEIIEKSPYDAKADIWSVGITAMELANGLPPYASVHPYRALFLIQKNEPPRLDAHFSKSFKDFVATCLCKNPAVRASAEQLVAHPFLRKARSHSLKELLKQRATRGENSADKIVFGGDSLTDSMNGSVRPTTTQSANDCQDQEARNWEFDFGSLGAEPGRAESSVTNGSGVDNNGKSGTGNSDAGTTTAAQDKTTDVLEERMSKVSYSDGSTTPAGLRAVSPAVSESNRTNGKHASKRNDEPASRSDVLSELILRVISQIRADVDANGSGTDGLITSLGALEVAFVDAERAKPGVAGTLLEALFKEALSTKSIEVRAILVRALEQKGTELTRR